MKGKLMKIFKLTQVLVLPDPMVTLPDQLLEPPHKRLEPSLPLLEQLDPLLVEVELDPLLLLRCWRLYAAKSRKEKSEVLDPLLLLCCWSFLETDTLFCETSQQIFLFCASP